LDELFWEYFEFLGEYPVTSQNETVLEVLEYLLKYGDGELGVSQMCADSLNELFMKFFEEMKVLGKVNQIKDDYLY
jgi:hypothetical protein